MTSTTDKTFVEVMTTIQNVMKGYRDILNSSKANDLTLSSTIKAGSARNVFDVYNSLKGSENVKLMCPGEFMMNSTYIIIYKVAEKTFIYVESDRVYKYPITKLKNINYN